MANTGGQRRERAATLGLPKVYSSFDSKARGTTMSTAPRKMWNHSWFEPSESRRLPPAPGHYNPDPPPTKKTVYLPKSTGRDTLSSTIPDTPGPGYYNVPTTFFSGTDVSKEASSPKARAPLGVSSSAGQTAQSSHAAMGASQAVSPVNDSRAQTARPPPRPPVPPAESRGQTAKGPRGANLLAPGPQTYTPNWGSVIPTKKLGASMCRSDRFNNAAIASAATAAPTAPGPGTYRNVFPLVRESATGPRFSSRRRSLAEGDLRHAGKAPGPGSYTPQVNAKGKMSNTFARIPSPSAFNVPIEKLHDAHDGL